MKLKLENFQSIENAELEFPIGVTVIRGKNGSGKTACFRAIEGALTNPSGTANYIKHGARETRVSLENEGNSLTWIKTPSTSAYIDNSNGKLYNKASKLDSRDIADLGFYFNSKDKIVNLQDEWSVLFPFGESDSEMFKLFEDVFNISCATTVIDEFKKDESAHKSCLAQLNTELEKTKKDINDIDRKLEIIDENFVLELGKEIKLLSDSCEELSSAINVYKSNKPILTRAVPELISLTEVEDLSNQCTRLREGLSEYGNALSYLRPIPAIDTALFSLDFSELDSLEQSLQSYRENLKNLEKTELDLMELVDKETELKNKLGQFTFCPTCGRPMEN